MAFADLNAWVDFELGEDVRDEARLLQDEQWKGAVADGRAHVSHREAARLHAPQFVASIFYYHQAEAVVDCSFVKSDRLHRVSPELLRHIFDFVCAQGQMVITSLARRTVSSNSSPNHSNFRLVVRKRPLLPLEMEFGEFDCIHAAPAPAPVSSPDNMAGACTPRFGHATLHDGRLARNGRRLTMTHRTYIADCVISEADSSSAFVAAECERLLRHAVQGGHATLLNFGQTGAGKTFTFKACLSYLCEKLADAALSLTFYEIFGKKAFDLLCDRKGVFLRADENDVMHVRGALALKLPGPDLNTLLAAAMALRSSQATERNPLSSRSHAVCTLLLANGGSLRLVDLAGSERNYETVKMSAAQHRDSADINKALWALKGMSSPC